MARRRLRSEPLINSRLDRRTFLALAGGLLTGCSASTGTASIPPSAAGTTRARGSTPPPVPTAEPSPEPTSRRPSREEIVARYAEERPAAWGVDVPGVVTVLPTNDPVVALTFDACGGARGSGYDAALVSTLRAAQVPATLFLNRRWILANPHIAADLAADPLFEIADHGTLHLPLSVDGSSAYGIAGTGGPGEVYDEVVGNTETLTELTGAPPRFFRSGTAHCDDVAARIVRDLGATVVNFDVNGDSGATQGPAQVAASLGTAVPGSIVLCHMNQPAGGTADGVAAALPRLADAGLRFVRLSEHLS